MLSHPTAGRAALKLLAIAVTLLVATAAFGPAHVRAEVGDSASGGGDSPGHGGCGGQFAFEFEAIGGAGNTAQGTYLFECDFNSDGQLDSYFIGEVECLAVEGHRAFFSGPVVQSSFASEVGRDYGVVVVDADAAGAPLGATDEISNYYLDFPCEYPSSEAFMTEVTAGDIAVTDATPPPPTPTGPTSKDDCKNGGWRDYPALEFKNQGSASAT